MPDPVGDFPAVDVPSPPQLVPVLSVGISDVPGSVAALPGDVVAYVSGHTVATCSLDTSVRPVVSEPCASVRSITAMAASHSREWIAVAETTAGGSGPQITLLHVAKGMERCAVLTGPGVSKYTSVSFSGDDKHIVAIGYDEDQTCSLFHEWEWAAGAKPVASGQVPGLVRKVTPHPRFHTNLVTQHPEQLLLLRKGSSGYKTIEIAGLKCPSGSAFVDHAWLSDGRLVVATSDRLLQVVDNAEVTETHTLGRTINCLLALHDNLLLVSLAKGHLAVYRCGKKETTTTRLEMLTVLTVPDGGANTGSGDHSVTHMSVSVCGNKVACKVKGGPVYVVNVKLALSHFAKDDQGDLWQEALPAMHSGAITGICPAVKRNFVVTLSSDDLTVRVWQYSPLRLVLTHFCHHVPTAAAIDPWARSLVIAYVDSCRCYSIVEGMLLEVAPLMLQLPGSVPQELTKASLVRYNPTGHLIAAVAGRDIAIFSTLHHRQLALLRAHFTAVADITWSDDGLYLASASEGEVYTWHMETFTKVQANTVKALPNSSVACTKDFGQLAVGVGTQGVRLLDTKRAGTRAAMAVTKGAPGQGPPSSSASGPQPFRVPGKASAVAVVAQKDAAAAAAAAAAGGAGPKDEAASAKRKAEAMGMLKGFIAVNHAVARNLYADGEAAALYSGAAGSGGGAPGSDPKDASELFVRSHYNSIMAPAPGCLVLLETEDDSGGGDGSGEQWLAAVGTQGMGRARVATLPPQSNEAFQEYALHQTEISALAAHSSGRLLFSGDISGCWRLHIVLPGDVGGPGVSAARAAAAAAMEAEGSLPHGRPPPPPAYSVLITAAALRLHSLMPLDLSDNPLDVVMVRGVDMAMLKEAARELKDKLAKAATQTEYKLYEREQEVRRVLEGELTSWRESSESARTELLHTKDALERNKMIAAQAQETLRAELNAQLVEARSVAEGKLAYEIERTNKAEATLARAKAKFGKRLWEVEETRASGAVAAAEQKAFLESNVSMAQAGAVKAVNKAREQMDLETRLDLELNDTEILRVGVTHDAVVANEKGRLEVLLAKHTLQAGLYHKTIQENEELITLSDHLTKECSGLRAQVQGLSEELDAMHSAWAERDARQRVQDAEVKDLMQRMQQSQMFTSLATSRIEELNAELDPVKEARADAQEHVTKLEELQVRQAERRLREMLDTNTLRAQHAIVRRELAESNAAAAKREAYFANFSTQLFRTIHAVDKEQWSVVFGKLHADFLAGRDKASWDKYLSASSPTKAKAGKGVPQAASISAAVSLTPFGGDAPATSAGSPLPSGGAAAAAADGSGAGMGGSGAAFSAGGGKALGRPVSIGQTSLEYQTHMSELQEHVRHLENAIKTKQESRDKESTCQRLVVKRMVTENMAVIEEANAYRRELRSAKEEVDRLTAELAMARSGAVSAQLPSSLPGQIPMRRASGGAAAVFASPSRLARAASDVSSRPSTVPNQTTSGLTADAFEYSTADGGRDMSANELKAAAAANSAAAAAARATSAFAGSRGGAFGAIPEDGPSAAGDAFGAWDDGEGGGASASGGQQQRGQQQQGVRPGSLAVSGDMPSGGWWLNGGEGGFQVAASLSTILKGGNSAMVSTTSRPGTSQGPAPSPYLSLSSHAHGGGGASRPGTSPSSLSSHTLPHTGSGAAASPTKGFSGGGVGSGGGGGGGFNGAAAGPVRVTLSRPGTVASDYGKRPGSRSFTPATPAQGPETLSGLYGLVPSTRLDPGSELGSSPGSPAGLAGSPRSMQAALSAFSKSPSGGITTTTKQQQQQRPRTSPSTSPSTTSGGGGAPQFVRAASGGPVGAPGAGAAAALPVGYLTASMLQGTTKPPSPTTGPAKMATLGGGFRSYVNRNKH